MKKIKESLSSWMVCSVIGRDRPGIVAKVSMALYKQNYNIEALSQTTILGQFAMILIASPSRSGVVGGLREALNSLAGEMNLDIDCRSVDPKEMVSYRAGETEPFVITVRGEDRPGLAFGITEILAESGINITSLDAKVTPVGSRLEYIQIFEVDIPKSLDFGIVHQRLRDRGQELGVAVDLQHRQIFKAINQI
jgi:glycine cleavage system transcriptional repressor